MNLKEDLHSLIKHWDGKVSIKEGKNGLLQMTFMKKYKCLNEDHREVVLEKVIGSHGFMTIEGDKDGNLHFSIPVRSDSLKSFLQLCNQLNKLESVDNLLLAVAN